MFPNLCTKTHRDNKFSEIDGMVENGQNEFLKNRT